MDINTQKSKRTTIIDKQKLELLLSKIQERAYYTHCLDEFGDDYNPAESKNYDDAFEDGSAYGGIEFARELLHILTEDNQ